MKLFWDYTSEKEKVPEGGAVYTVFCLDISESMANDDAWGQANEFIMDYLNGRLINILVINMLKP